MNKELTQVADLRRKQHQDRRGTTAVEFALAFPLLLVVTFFCFDMARLSMMRNLAHNAAYETARFGMMEGVTQADAQALAQGILARLGTQGATIEINDGEALDGPSPTVNVEVTIPVKPNALILDQVFEALGLMNSWDDEKIVSEITMRKERYSGFFDVDTI